MSHSLCIRSPAATAHGANASQQEYLVQKDLEPETDNATRTTPRSRTFFLDLPGEVRNEIYHLALFHFETNGIISPSVHSKWPSVTLVEGVRIMILEGHPLQPQHHTLDFKTTANARSNHFCTPKCLLQPNLTRVSRQIRREALPIFYDSNWFHLEMGGCAVTTTEGYRIDTRRPGENHMWSPQRWWRAIGDENLRLIDRFSFVCQPHVSGGKQENRSIEYCRSTGVVERYVHETLPCEVRRPFDLNVGFTGSEDDDATSLERWRFDKARLEPDDLDSGGGDDDTTCLSDVVLSAAALEKLMLAWEPNDLEYVTDHTACDLDTEVGWPRTGGGEGLCSEGQCREVVKMTYAEVAWKGVRSSLV